METIAAGSAGEKLPRRRPPTHAWLAVFIPVGAGLEIDPTNAAVAGIERYIILAGVGILPTSGAAPRE